MGDVETPPTPNPHVTPPQVVIVVGWLLIASAVMATGTRLGTKLSMNRKFTADDYLVVTAMLFGLAQMVATFVQANVAKSGAITGNDWLVLQKAFYASELLFIPTICLSKLSVLYSLFVLTPAREHKIPIIAFAILVGMVMLSFEFATAFQCSNHRWAVLSGQCFNQTSFWQAWGILDVATDVFMVAFPIYIVSTLQMSIKLKVIVAGVFSARAAAIAAAVCRLVYLTRSRATLQYSSFDFWTFILNTEIEQGLAIITACIPFLKPIFESLETGMLAPSHGLSTMMSGSGSGSGSRSKKSQISNESYKLRSRQDGHGINVSRRISTHSEDQVGLVKEETTTWVHPVPSNPV